MLGGTGEYLYELIDGRGRIAREGLCDGVHHGTLCRHVVEAGAVTELVDEHGLLVTLTRLVKKLGRDIDLAVFFRTGRVTGLVWLSGRGGRESDGDRVPFLQWR